MCLFSVPYITSLDYRHIHAQSCDHSINPHIYVFKFWARRRVKHGKKMRKTMMIMNPKRITSMRKRSNRLWNQLMM